jgi:hypothetical protein
VRRCTISAFWARDSAACGILMLAKGMMVFLV